MSASFQILRPLDGQSGFVTGASGFVGTALVCRLIFDCKVKQLFLLCRGGEKRLYNVWAKHLPADQVLRLQSSGKITVFDGDIEKPMLGMSAANIKTLQQNIGFIVHSASSINLQAGVYKILPAILHASKTVAVLASSCPGLEQFVYVSTAYANSYLHDPSVAREVTVEERMYAETDGSLSLDAAQSEVALLEQGKVCPEINRFPFAYAYVKHLTERVLTNHFRDSGTQVLIIRPSVIGPADNFPYVGYEVSGSTPLTSVLAALIVDNAEVVTFASPFAQPKTQTGVDEVPVDIVVNRLVVAMAQRCSGIVHATSGVVRSRVITDLWEAAMNERFAEGRPRLRFVKESWNSRNCSRIARLFKVVGTRYDFQSRTAHALHRGMTGPERDALALFALGRPIDMTLRSKAITELFAEHMNKAVESMAEKETPQAKL